MPHLHDKIDFTTEVFVIYHNKVLLRKHDKYKIWLSIGGHVELDEDPTQAAIREVKEEVGIDVQLFGQPISADNEGENGYHELLPPRFMNRHHISETHDHVTLTYFAIAKTDDLLNQDDEHSDELRWFTQDELADPKFGIRNSIQHYALSALQTVKE